VSDDVSNVDFWHRMERRGPESVVVSGTTLRAGSRVRLRPRSHTDILDLALDGRVAVVRDVEQDGEGELHLAVTLEDDPGSDLGDARLPGHRFFYAVTDVEPLGPAPADAHPVRVLVAGIGNVFLGDDGFGVEVVRRLAARPGRPGVDVVEFGIRGMDLVYALLRGYDAVIFVDAAPRGEPAGTLTLLDAGQYRAGQGAAVEPHGMDPVSVLRLARELGRVPERTLVLCCEPAMLPAGEPGEDVLVGLSAPVRAALPGAVDLVETAVAELAEAIVHKGEKDEEEVVRGRAADGRRRDRTPGP
jgi:hydrogenase maturation protease